MRKAGGRNTIKILVTIFLLLSVAIYAYGERVAWDCPECGRAGNTGNYCGHCSYPAPWITRIISAECGYPVIVKGNEQEFTVVTTDDVQNLMLYSEDGKTLVKSWTANENSTADNGKRKWTVKQVIGSAGDRKLVFRGGMKSTTADTNAVPVSFKVENSGIISAECAHPKINRGSVQKFTVKTTTDIKYLMLYEDTGVLLTTWEVGKYGKTNQSVITWEVTYKLQTSGKHQFTFKARTTTEVLDSLLVVSCEVFGSV